MRPIIISLGLALGPLAACGPPPSDDATDAGPSDRGRPDPQAPEAGLPDTTPEFGHGWRAIAADPTRPLAERIAAARAGLESADPDDRSWFGLGEIHLSPELDADERVMILDVLVPSPDMLRQRHRIVGFYEIAADGHVASIAAQWLLPSAYGEVLSAFANFPSVPASALESLAQPLARFANDVPLPATHGLAVHWLLADRVPDRGLVYVDTNRLTFHQAIPDVVCAIREGASDRDLEPLWAHANRIADELRALMLEHRVSYVNASWGLTLASVREPWASVCGEPPPSDALALRILAAYEPVFAALFATPRVATLHAALASPADEHAPFDQSDPRFFNRLRVGALGTRSNALPPGGSDRPPPDALLFPEAVEDADVYIASGCRSGECRTNGTLTMIRPVGVGVSTLPLTQTSFVAPLALAEVVARRTRDGSAHEAITNELIEEIFDELASGCGAGPCFHDPLRDPAFPRP